jgi:short-subunit dehydrogenase
VPVTIITGASSGIGYALAVELARRGHRLGLVARRADALGRVAERLRRMGTEIAVAQADVADRAAIEEAVRAIEATLGPCEWMIANAGVGAPTPAHRVTVDEIERIFAVNIHGVLYTLGSVLPGMLERSGGRLAVVSSVAGFRGLPGSAAYSASKACVSALLESFRVDLAARGVLCTTIHPGFVATPMSDRNRSPRLFLVTAEHAAVVIADGIERGDAEVTFPWQMRLLMAVVRWLPNWLYDRAVRRFSPLR